MAVGLLALLDDVAAIARLAAASVDDVAAVSMKASGKALGVVVDDAAVTPAYVAGLSPARELPMIWRIARGSLRNKLLILLPVALLLSAVAPWAITPLLMLGGLYLAYEGAAKLLGTGGHGLGHGAADADRDRPPEVIEQDKVAGAIRTDMILSAEIMAIALAEVADRPLGTQAAALAAVSIVITAGVYGVVGLIVKMDDIGLHLAGRGGTILSAIGRAMVRTMPLLLGGLATLGTAAMLWVGGGILLHGLEQLGWTTPAAAAHAVAGWAAAATPFAPALGRWLGRAVAAALFGAACGGAIALILRILPLRRHPSP